MLGVESYVVFFRILSPTLLTFMAWIVWRSPYQERVNRLLATFLAVLAFGFWIEVLWDIFLAEKGPVMEGLRRMEDLAGYVDPPILLGTALVLTGRGRRSLLAGLAVGYAIAGGWLWWGQGLGEDWLPIGSIVYVNTTYLASFVLLWRAYTEEERRFFSRQLHFLTLGVGFAALSRMSAFFLTGGPRFSVQPTIGARTGWSLLLSLAALATVTLLVLLDRLAWRRPVQRVVRPALALASILVVFFGFWYAALVLTDPTPLQPLAAYFFNFRWVIFAGIVGYGVLRFQLFDFELRTRQVVTLVGLTLAAIGVAVAVGVAAEAGGASVLAARLAGLGVALALGGPAFFLLYRAAGRGVPGEESPYFQRRRLEIYQATLEYALRKPNWTDEERRFVDTLREVFEVTPEEHERVVAGLRSPEDRTPGSRGAALVG